MKVITLDAVAWASPDDFYSALLPQLGAPVWHGRNLNALDDSLGGGSINALEPPLKSRSRVQTSCPMRCDISCPRSSEYSLMSDFRQARTFSFNFGSWRPLPTHCRH